MELSRRAVLRGTGALLGLPFLESLAPRRAFAAGQQARPPLRMGFFVVTGGTVIESWKPRTAGPLTEMPSILEPLDFAKDDVVVVSGLSHHGSGSEGHNASAVILTGAERTEIQGGWVKSDVSIDQAAARVYGRETCLPSLELGIINRGYSFRTPETMLPYEENPRLAFDRMFRGRNKVVPNWSRRPVALSGRVDQSSKPDTNDQSVIDFVLEESRDLGRRLGMADRRRLEEYFESIRSVERRIRLLEAVVREEKLDLEHPGPSTLTLPTNIPATTESFRRMRQLADRDTEYHGAYIRLMADLMVLAFQTDTARVVSLAAGSDDAYFYGVVTVGYDRQCHVLEHQGNADPIEKADPIAREGLRQIHTWYTEIFAEVIRKMKAIDEGGTTLLDNSLILYTSYMANGGHSRDDYPVLLAGKAQGKLKGGRHLAVKPRTPMSNLFVEMLHLGGIPVDSFGESRTSKHAAYNGRLPGLV